MPAKRRELLLALAMFLFVNALAFAAVGLRFASLLEGSISWTVRSYAGTLVLGHMPFLALMAGIPLGLGIAVWPRNWWLKWLAPSLFAILILLLLIDSVVLSQYRFHLNAMVWELLLGGAAGEIFRFDWSAWLAGSVAVSLLFTFELWLSRFAISHFKRATSRMWRSVVIALILLTVSAHLIHGFAEAMYRNDVTRVARLFPLYFPLTMSEQLYRAGIVNRDAVRGNQALAKERSFSLNYPRAPLRFREQKALPNIVLIVVDSWRYDSLNSENMPRLWSAAEGCERFEHHLSGSNGTRGGIFSLFYALPSLFWEDTITERRGPMLIKALQNRNYALGVFASAPLTSPTFDKNVFVDVYPLRRATKVDGRRVSGYEADEQAVREWFSFLESETKSQIKRSFFGFLFLDAPHNYTHPPEHRVFEPAWDVPRYLILNNGSDPTPLVNLYRNSIHFVDAKVGEILDDLRARGLWDNTIVIVTGDHGQEFNDFKRNYWGHGSNFGDYQLHTPLVVHWPGRASGVLTHPTSHYDLVPTLLADALGVENPPSDFSFGSNVFTPKSEPWFLAGSFDNFGIVERDRVTVKFSTGNYEIYSPTMEPLDVPLRVSVVTEVLASIKRFFR